MTDDEQRWCEVALKYGGDFLKFFAAAMFRADPENEIILRPTLRILMEKCPKYQLEFGREQQYDRRSE